MSVHQLPRIPILLLVLLPTLGGCQAEDNHQLVFVGLDGATWDVIDPMMARGELPHFRELVDRGARADLVVLPPLASPVVWTTLATGMFGRRHNILDFVYPYSPGDKRPVESTLRREPAVWNIASDADRRVGIVGYYVTHPAEVVNGFVISDRALATKSGSTSPPELAAEIDLVRSGEGRQEVYSRFLPWSYKPQDSADPAAEFHSVSRIVRGRVDGALVRAENARRASLDFYAPDLDLFMSYFQIIDRVSHSAWIYFDDSDFERKPDPRDKELLGELVPEAYRFADEFLGELMERVGDGANILLVSDHGSGSATGQYRIRDPKLVDLLSGNHRSDGLLLAAGPDIEPGTYERISMMEVAPLVLRLLDLPVSRELPGRVPEELLTERFRDRFPARSVASYDLTWEFADAVADSEAEEEALEELRALGYIGASSQSGEGPEAEAEDFWSVEQELRRNELEGEILYYLMRNQPEQARRLRALIRQRDPAIAEPLTARIRVLAATIESDLSFPVFPEGALSDFLNEAPAGSP